MYLKKNKKEEIPPNAHHKKDYGVQKYGLSFSHATVCTCLYPF